ncbi:MAG: hypothetical protein JO166_23345 [Deltaproteobacteria bacterium]|nr:hypothetical protein [Deltaproteobacteria bacterium]
MPQSPLAESNEMVAAIHAAIRDYERCATASLARDDCGAEFIDLQLTHRDFEAEVGLTGHVCWARVARIMRTRRSLRACTWIPCSGFGCPYGLG